MSVCGASPLEGLAFKSSDASEREEMLPVQSRQNFKIGNLDGRLYQEHDQHECRPWALHHCK